MNIPIKILLIALLGVIAFLLLRRLIRSIFNLRVMMGKGNTHDISKQKNGIVFNKKTGKLEADQSLILPF